MSAQPGAPGVVELLARVRARVLEREGIAMVLGLFDRRAGADEPVAAVEAGVRLDGEDLADASTVVADALLPDTPLVAGPGPDSALRGATEGEAAGVDGVEAALIDVLAVLAEDRVKAPVSATPHSTLLPRPASIDAARRRRRVGTRPLVPDLDHTVHAIRLGSLVRVVNWHNTPASARADLRRELAWYVDRFDPLLPEDLDRFVETGRWHRDRPGFVPAFYDGYLNNATVAAPVCDELGITAWFYPPTGFVTLPPQEQRDWAATHEIDLLEEERDQPALAMTLDQLDVVSRRHVVAAHTATHATLASCVTPEDVEREVLGPARLIEEVTGRRPPALAWKLGAPFDPDSPGGMAMVDAGIRYAVSNTAIQRIC